MLRTGDVASPPPHQAFGRCNGVGCVLLLQLHSTVSDLPPASGKVPHHRGQQHPALFVGQAFGHAMAHGSDQRVRGAQVYAHGNAPLVGIGRLAGFGNLQQRHECLVIL